MFPRTTDNVLQIPHLLPRKLTTPRFNVVEHVDRLVVELQGEAQSGELLVRLRKHGEVSVFTCPPNHTRNSIQTFETQTKATIWKYKLASSNIKAVRMSGHFTSFREGWDPLDISKFGSILFVAMRFVVEAVVGVGDRSRCRKVVSFGVFEGGITKVWHIVFDHDFMVFLKGSIRQLLEGLPNDHASSMSPQDDIGETVNIFGDLVHTQVESHTLVLLHALTPTEHVHLAPYDVRVEFGDGVDKLLVVVEKGRQKVYIGPVLRSHVREGREFKDSYQAVRSKFVEDDNLTGRQVEHPEVLIRYESDGLQDRFLGQVVSPLAPLVLLTDSLVLRSNHKLQKRRFVVRRSLMATG